MNKKEIKKGLLPYAFLLIFFLTLAKISSLLQWHYITPFYFLQSIYYKSEKMTNNL